MFFVTILLICRYNNLINITMDSNGIVAGLDVHKDSVYLCIMGHDESIIFQKTIRSAANGTVSDAQ